MSQLIRQRQLAANDWTAVESVEAAGPDNTLLPLAEYLKLAAAGAAAPNRGVLLKPEDQDLAALQALLSQLPLIAVQFGSSGEGRGYTQARLLRERFAFKGELRARGAVRVDQVWFLARCGFDAFELAEGEDAATAIAQLERFSVAYQTGLPETLTQPRARYGR